MEYYPLKNDHTNGFFVPEKAIEEISLCTAPQLRVLLLALDSKEGICPEKISETLGISTEDCEDLLSYWVKKGILREENHSAEMKETGMDRTVVLTQVRGMLGRSLSISETNTILSLLNDSGISPDILLPIIRYTSHLEKPSVRYLQKLALAWKDEGIDTYEKCEEKIKKVTETEEAEIKIKSLLGIGERLLTGKEKETAVKWVRLGLAKDLIALAQKRCLENTGKLSFAYMDKVLSLWKQEGIDSVEKANLSRKNEKAPASAPSFDIAEIERRMKTEDGVI